MNCEKAREQVVIGAGVLRGWRGRRHVPKCRNCSAWFGELRQTEQLLQAVVSHDMPSSLEQRLRERLPAFGSQRAGHKEGTRMKGIRMKVVAGALSLALLVGIAVAAFLVWGPGAVGVAWGEIEDALRSVDTVHMTGEMASFDQNTVAPFALRKDKWVRREPFAVYEEVSPVNPRTAEEASRRYIFAGSAEKVYWYFPARGNRAVIGKGLQANFLDDMLAPLGPSEASGSRPSLNMTGQSEVDGKRVILLDLHRENQRTELAVDAQTKLLLRLREFVVGADGRETEVTRLRFEYNKTPPAGVFDWAPPAGAAVVDKR